MAIREYHVQPASDGRWHVRRGGAESPDAFYPTREAAISAARVLATFDNTAVLVHEGEGRTSLTNPRGGKASLQLIRRIRVYA